MSTPTTTTRSTEQRKTEQRRPQRRSRREQEDRFHIDPGMVPQGMDWQWNTETVLGAPQTENLINMQEDGWTPVTWEKFPALKRPPGLTERGLSDPVRRGGLMLMERPIELTNEARLEDRQAADEQVKAKLTEVGQTPSETLTRDHPKLNNHITRTFAPAGIEIPDDK